MFEKIIREIKDEQLRSLDNADFGIRSYSLGWCVELLKKYDVEYKTLENKVMADIISFMGGKYYICDACGRKYNKTQVIKDILSGQEYLDSSIEVEVKLIHRIDQLPWWIRKELISEEDFQFLKEKYLY